MFRCASISLVASALVLDALVPSTTGAQALETPEGTVEFIGLHHWTPERVRDTLAVLRPDVPLASGACAGVLQFEVGFPAAAVHGYGFHDDEPRTVITLVEPEEVNRVRYGSVPVDSLAPLEQWTEAYDILTGEKSWGWGIAVQFRTRSPSPEYWSRLGNLDSTSYLEARAFLNAHASEDDLRTAIDILSSDRAGLNRMIAIGILSNFPEREEALHALVRAARGFGPEDLGRNAATRMLFTVAREAPDSVDWSPVVDDLSALLDGTNLYAFMPILTILGQTGLSPDLTRELLSDGAPLVIDHLAARSSTPRVSARKFLERVSGEDHGDEVEEWKTWIASLRATSTGGPGIQKRVTPIPSKGLNESGSIPPPSQAS